MVGQDVIELPQLPPPSAHGPQKGGILLPHISLRRRPSRPSDHRRTRQDQTNKWKKKVGQTTNFTLDDTPVRSFYIFCNLLPLSPSLVGRLGLRGRHVNGACIHF